MKIINYKCTHLLILLTYLAYVGPSFAQTTTGPEADPVVEATDATKEENDAASNVRDSVNENLDTQYENLNTAAQQESEPTATASEQPESNSWLDRIKSIPGYLQSVPERVPFIRERELIFFGRMEIDYAYYSSGITASDSGFRIRSLRAGLAKALEHNISLKAEVDLTDGDSNFADLYVRYRNKKYGLFTAGNQKVAQTLVNQTSRISRTYMEEPLPAEAFGLDRRLALGWDLHKSKGGVHATLFGPDLNGSIGDSGWASRIYLNPTRSRFSLFHIGASFVSENMSRKTRFYAHPESRVTDKRLVDTGIFEDVNEQQIAALEIAGARESFMFRGEFFRAKWDRNTVANPVFKGFYVQASWVLTGETFKYAQGKFIRIRTQNPRGAWEAAVRFSKIDLNDQGVLGGEEKNLAVAINWYAPGNQFRVMSNLIFVRADEYAGNESPTIFQIRGQFHW